MRVETSTARSWSSALLLDGRRRWIAAIAASSLCGGLAEAGFLVLVTRTGFAVADGRSEVDLVGETTVSIGVALATAMVLVIARMVLAMLSISLAASLGTRVVSEVRRDLAHAFLHSSYPVQAQERSGQLQELLTTFATHATALVGRVANGVVAASNLLALFGLAVIVDPLGSSVIIVAVAVLGVLLRPIRRLVKREAGRTAKSGMEFATSLNELSQLGMEVHTFGVQQQTEARIIELVDMDGRSKHRLAVLNGVVPTLYTGLAYLALTAAIAAVAASDAANVTSLGAVMLLMLRSLSYGQALQVASTGVASARPFVESLRDYLTRYRDAAVVDHGEPIGEIGTLTLDSVSFHYVPGVAVIKDISASIMPREVVGIVGPSGGGKSTLVQLMLGLRQPSSGRILADGRDIRRLSREEWSRKVTFVPQAAHLIAGSVADNIRFLRDGISPDDIARAAKLAHLHEDVMRWPEQYDRDVGERGGHLSGGQQQRLCIARALVESPDVLILDEPTSALDVRSESLIRETLTELGQRMTVVVIAHRLSTLDICDTIMVIQEGELRAFDTPSNLARTSDFYAEALVLSGLSPSTTQLIADSGSP